MGKRNDSSVVVDAKRREERPARTEHDPRGVDLGDEELGPGGDVGAEQRLGSFGDLVVVIAQPAIEPRRVACAQDHDLVLADLELRLHDHADGAERVPRHGTVGALGSRAGPAFLVVRRFVAGVALPVLDEPRGGERIEPIEDGGGEDLDVALLEHHRYRHHHREVVRRPVVSRAQREHGARPVAHEHGHRGVVGELGVGAGDVEPAERARRARREERRAERGYGEGPRGRHRGEDRRSRRGKKAVPSASWSIRPAP